MSTLLSAPLAGCVRLASTHGSVAEQDVVSCAGKQRCCRNGVVCPPELVGCPWRWWGGGHQWKSLSRWTSGSTCSMSCLTYLGLQRPSTEYLQVRNSSSAAGNSSNGQWFPTIPLEVVQDVVWLRKINAYLLLFAYAVQTRSPVKGCGQRKARYCCSHLLKTPQMGLRQLLSSLPLPFSS